MIYEEGIGKVQCKGPLVIGSDHPGSLRRMRGDFELCE
jgi:hypothetical protein